MFCNDYVNPSILFLQCGDWLQLKILEMTPEITTLGNTLAEALELQKAHDDVLQQLQVNQFLQQLHVYTQTSL